MDGREGGTKIKEAHLPNLELHFNKRADADVKLPIDEVYEICQQKSSNC